MLVQPGTRKAGQAVEQGEGRQVYNWVRQGTVTQGRKEASKQKCDGKEGRRAHKKRASLDRK